MFIRVLSGFGIFFLNLSFAWMEGPVELTLQECLNSHPESCGSHPWLISSAKVPHQMFPVATKLVGYVLQSWGKEKMVSSV